MASGGGGNRRRENRPKEGGNEEDDPEPEPEDEMEFEGENETIYSDEDNSLDSFSSGKFHMIKNSTSNLKSIIKSENWIEKE